MASTERGSRTTVAAALGLLVAVSGCGGGLDAWRPASGSGDALSAAPRTGTLRLHVDSVNAELVVDLSPVELAPHSSHSSRSSPAARPAREPGDRAMHDAAGHDMARTPFEHVVVPFDAWLTGFDAEVLDGDGNRLPREMLHHVNLMSPDSRDLFRPIMQRIAAAGEETSPIEVPWPFGVPVHAGERLAAFAMLHDPDGTAAGPVQVRMRIRYARRGRIAVKPFFIDASPPPGPAGWDLPPGHSTRSWEGSPAVSGRVLAVGGHLHRYGQELILEDVVAGRVLFRLLPILSEDGGLEDVERRHFIARLGIPMSRERRYRITAVYENPTGDTIRDGAMGAIGGMILPSARPWPRADAGDPLYRRDLQMLLDATAGHAH